MDLVRRLHNAGSASVNSPCQRGSKASYSDGQIQPDEFEEANDPSERGRSMSGYGAKFVHHVEKVAWAVDELLALPIGGELGQAHGPFEGDPGRASPRRCRNRVKSWWRRQGESERCTIGLQLGDQIPHRNRIR